MEFKTCEEYVLNELNNALTKNEKLFNRLEEMDKENFELNEENKKLKRLFKTIAERGNFIKGECADKEAFSTFLYSWNEDEKKVIEELKKYIGDEDEENK